MILLKDHKENDENENILVRPNQYSRSLFWKSRVHIVMKRRQGVIKICKSRGRW